MTIRDVAKRSGVSIATVSRVLNGNANVSDSIKLAVENAIEELNYQKPEKKRKKATKLFAVIVRNITNPFFAQMIDVLEEEAYKHGRSLLLFNSRNNLQLERTFLAECENHNVDGVFLIPRSLKSEHLSTLQDFSFPIVLLTATSPLVSGVGTNHKHGGMLAAKHLLQQGHRRIGYIGTDTQQSDRFIGFKQTLKNKNTELSEPQVLSPYTTETLTNFVEQQILTHESPLSALFCSDDICASQLFILLQQYEKTSSVEIIGFDDTFISQSLGFSSIKQPIKQIALIGFDIMINTLNFEQTNAETILLEPTLMLRRLPSSPTTARETEILRSTGRGR